MESPHNLEAERAILGGCLVAPNMIPHAERVLHDGDWWRDAHRLIWRAILRVHGAGRAVDLVTVRDELGESLEAVGGPAYVASLDDGVPRSTNVPHYACIVAQNGVRRQMMTAAASGSPHADLDALAGRLAKLSGSSTAVRLVRAADVEAEVIPWLWHKRIAPGEVTVISGDPGAGKSLIAIDVCANLTAGSALADDPDTDREPASCVWIGHSSEDSPARTIVPRFIAAGGDGARLHVLDSGQDVTLADACAAAAELEPALVVVDSWAAWGADAAKDSSGEAAARYIVFDQLRAQGAAILVITHDRKGDAGDTVQTVAGSMQTTAKPRMVLHVKGGALRALKGNLTGRADTLAFMVEGTNVNLRGQTFSDVPRLTWDAKPIPAGSPSPVDDSAPGVTVDDVVEFVTGRGTPPTRNGIRKGLGLTSKRQQMALRRVLDLAVERGRLETCDVKIRGRDYTAYQAVDQSDVLRRSTAFGTSNVDTDGAAFAGTYTANAAHRLPNAAPAPKEQNAVPKRCSKCLGTGSRAAGEPCDNNCEDNMTEDTLTCWRCLGTTVRVDDGRPCEICANLENRVAEFARRMSDDGRAAVLAAQEFFVIVDGDPRAVADLPEPGVQVGVDAAGHLEWVSVPEVAA